jgi:predicted DNA-binding transcriptional regulator YafY
MAFRLLRNSTYFRSGIFTDKNSRYLVISLRLIVNFELLQELLSYCPHVKVIQPLSLKEKLNELLRKGLEVNGE